jgi:hypothetical protein
VALADLQHPLLHVPPPHASAGYRFPPRPTGFALLALAAVLALGGSALLLLVALGRLEPARRHTRAPLERVLGELAAASSNGDSGRRRRALEQLARELEPLDPGLSAESRVLAWGPEDPRAEAVADLAGRARTAVRR